MATPRTAKLAYEALRVIAKAAINGEQALTYSELAVRLELPNPTGRGLGGILDEARRRCALAGCPDASVFVVTKDSLENGDPMPSEGSFHSDGTWGPTKLSREEIRKLQQKVREFDWRSKPSLNL